MAESKLSAIWPAVIIGVVTSLVVAAITSVVAFLTRDPPPSNVNVALVLDISEEMGEKFGKTTRFDAAVAELRTYVGPRDSDNLSLWTTKGGCDGVDEAVSFGTNNADEITAALDGLESEGKANLGDAMIEATSAFNTPDQFPAQVRKSVLVFTAGKDTCATEGYVKRFADRLDELGTDFNVKYHFFGLDIPPKIRRRLRDLQADLGSGAAAGEGSLGAHFSDTSEELEEDIERALAPPIESTESTEFSETPSPAPTGSTEPASPTPAGSTEAP